MAFITVPSMPIWSPATLLPPLLATCMPRKILPPPTTMPTLNSETDGLGDLAGKPVEDLVVDAESLVAEKRFAGELEQDFLEADRRLHHACSSPPGLDLNPIGLRSGVFGFCSIFLSEDR